MFDLASVVLVAAVAPLAPFSVLTEVPATLFIAWMVLRATGQHWRDLGLRRPAHARRALLQGAAAGFTLQAIALLGVLPALRSLGVALPDVEVFEVIHGDSLALLLHLVVGWTLAAGGEELIWRGFILNRIAGLLGGGPVAWWTGVLLSSALFGLAHAYQGTTGMVLTGLAGLAFGALYMMTGRNLWPIIVAHGTMNTISFLLLYAGAADWLA